MFNSIVKGSPVDPEKIDSLLLIQLGDIGDVVLTTPSIVALRERYGQSTITIAVRRKAKELMDDCPLIDKVIVADRFQEQILGRMTRSIRQICDLSRSRFDLAVDFRTGARGAVLARLSRAPQRISFHAHNEPFWRNGMFTHLADIPYQTGIYVADYYFKILQAFAVCDKPGPLKLWVNPQRYEGLEAIFRQQGLSTRSPYVVIQPFSLWAYKELPMNHYIEIIDILHDRFNLPVVIAGGPEDRIKAETIVDGCRSKPFNLAGQTSIGEMVALLAQSRLFIGIDSAGLHIAAAVDCPTVGIFGPSAPASWAPRGDGHKVVQPDMQCSPCREKGCQGSEESLCLQTMPLESLMSAVTASIDHMSSTRENQQV